MKILNFGSLNYDNVYTVKQIVNPGETVASLDFNIYCGGKGLNQSVALSRAGAPVYHAGFVGEDGEMLLDICRDNAIDTRNIIKVMGKSGHAVIQVNEDGENSIILFQGANGANNIEYIDNALEEFDSSDCILLQNEVNMTAEIIDRAYKKGMFIYLNPSPMNEKILSCDLNKVSSFIMNEIEGEAVTGMKTPEKIIKNMRMKFPDAEVVLTLGSKGCYYSYRNESFHEPACIVKALDTTAAGDTFTGYFISERMKGKGAKLAVKKACRAAAMAVTVKGAIPSIPVL